MCVLTKVVFLGFCQWEDLGLRDLTKVVKLRAMFMAYPSPVIYLGSLISIVSLGFFVWQI